MKLAALAVVLAIASTAAADPAPYSGPPGMYDEPTELVRQAPPQQRPARAGNGALRAAIIARFDRDGDGKLNPQERRRAIKALRRLARRLAQQKRAERRAARQGNGNGAPVDVDIDIDVR
jgi:hypothetical protein